MLIKKWMSKINQVIQPAVPQEYQIEFRQNQLNNNLFRLKIASIFLQLCFFLNAIVVMPSRSFEDLPILFAPFCLATVYQILILFSKKMKNKESFQWICCHTFFIGIATLDLVIFAVPISVNHISSFATFIFIMALIPDFKPLHSMLIMIIFYLWSVFFFVKNNQYTFIDDFISITQFLIFGIIASIIIYNNKVSRFNLKIANDKLSILSVTDALTRLPNKRAFFEHSNLLWNQCNTLRLPLSILMIDIDFFKKYNDSLGHLEGDKALIAVAAFMQQYFKQEVDFVARFGGEEFVCLIPFIDQKKAFTTATQLVQGVEDLKIVHPDSAHSKYITISVGVAHMIPDANISFEKMLENADNALYAAKESGRNRAVMAE